MDKEVYVRCNCSHLNFNQYVISFKGSEKSYPPSGELIVYESALVKQGKTSGLVKATLMEKNSKNSVVVIHDHEQGGVFSHVPNTEILD